MQTKDTKQKINALQSQLKNGYFKELCKINSCFIKNKNNKKALKMYIKKNLIQHFKLSSCKTFKKIEKYHENI